DAVQVAGRLEVVAERLLDDQAPPALGLAPLAHGVDHRLERARRDGEVVNAVAACLPLLVELVDDVDEVIEALRVREVRRPGPDPVGEPVPHVVAELVAAELLYRLLHAL